ncbi:MAG: Thermostable hemolysin [Rhodocyclaceae bacterium]|nr:Thermostable hemolysin [Rhodocyclaceae bacterium]
MPSVSNFLPPAEMCSSAGSWFSLFIHGLRPSGGIVRAHAGVTGSGVRPYELLEHASADRARVENFISQRFHESFGSRVEAFMPRLFSLRDPQGNICGAFGLRSASRRLFLEQYLDVPIERAIADRTGHRAERRTIVEVGHFSGTVPGAMRIMIRLLTERLHHEGFEWVAFTGTTGLRNAFGRMGLPLSDIQAADRERLPATERAAWGSYYDHDPRIVVGHVRQGYEALMQRASPPAPGQGERP